MTMILVVCLSFSGYLVSIDRLSFTRKRSNTKSECLSEVETHRITCLALTQIHSALRGDPLARTGVEHTSVLQMARQDIVLQLCVRRLGEPEYRHFGRFSMCQCALRAIRTAPAPVLQRQAALCTSAASSACRCAMSWMA